MLSWPDALCERLAAGGRRVVRYDLRDSGESTTTNPEAPAYTLRDLAADAAALADALGGGPAHLAGIGVSGMVAQVAALDHPGAFSALTLAGTRRSRPAGPTTTSPTTTRQRCAGCSRIRCPTGPTAKRWRISPPPAQKSSATTPSPRARSPRASGTARPAPQPRSRWPTRWAWSSPSSTANPAGASACPKSRSPRSSSTAAATRSSPSATARRSREIPGARLLVLEDAATAIPDAAARRGRRGNARARIENGACRAAMASAQQWASQARHGHPPAPAIGDHGTLEGSSEEPRPGPVRRGRTPPMSQ